MARWPVLLVLCALAAAGCSAGGDSTSSGRAPGQEAAEAPLQTAADDVRHVVRTAEVVVSVGDVAAAADRATDLVEAAGGFLFGQQADLEGDQEVQVTYKVPPARFRPTLDRLGGLGRTLSRNAAAQDVTDEVVDLEGRMASAEASIERLRTLLGQAATTADLIAVERELERRQGDLESMQGRLRVLRSRTDMATIDARFTEETELEVSHDLPGFLDGLRSGGVALATIAIVLLAIVGFALPFTPLALGGRWAWLRHRRNHPKPPPRPPAPPLPHPFPPRPPRP